MIRQHFMGLIKAVAISLAVALFILDRPASLVVAQAPGTGPPSQLMDQTSESTEDGLPIEAFMFQTESGSLVVVPSMSWEKIEELMDTDAGVVASRQRFSYQSLTITGSADSQRAELQVTLRLTVEPTGGNWVAIPLRMESFHRIAPPDVTGVDEYFVALDPTHGGNLLYVKTDVRAEVMLRMNMAARVKQLSHDHILDFQLPDVPSKIDVSVDEQDVSGEVTGRGDETLRTTSSPQQPTRFTIESSGGNFSLRWGSEKRSYDEHPLLEVNSDLQVRWDSPQAQPIVHVRSEIQSLRGSVKRLRLRLPEQSQIIDQIRLGSSGQEIELGSSQTQQAGQGIIYDIVIPIEEQQQRVSLDFDLQLAHSNASAESPLAFRVPEIIGALSHRGTIEVQIPSEYRLRWNQLAWVRSVADSGQDDGSSDRRYRFEFDRSSFALPPLQAWLVAPRNQLRANATAIVEIHQSIANLDLVIELNGRPSSGTILIDPMQWQLSSIERTDTGESLEMLRESDGTLSIDASLGGNDSVTIAIRGEQPLRTSSDRISLALPRLIIKDDGPVTRSATLEIHNLGRYALVVDTSESTGLTRMSPSVDPVRSGALVSRFRLTTTGDEAAIIVGSLTEQPLRISMTGQGTIRLDGDRLRTTVDWQISPALDLEGNLPVRIPNVTPATDLTSVGSVDPQSGNPVTSDPIEGDERTVRDPGLDGREPDDASQWVVTVGQDDAPAILRQIQGDRYVLISERLAVRPVSIRWRREQPVPVSGTIIPVPLPRPDLADVTLEGTLAITLQGDRRVELTAIDQPSGERFELNALPREPLRLRMQQRDRNISDVSIRQTILRTVVGRNTRHEQLLVQLQGGDQFRVGLPATIGDIAVESLIDGQPQPVTRDGSFLLVTLPGDAQLHVVDLRIWVRKTTSSWMANIEPLLQLPIESGSVIWQIIAPTDGHVIWASPTLGRNMIWQFDGWHFFRQPRYDDPSLLALMGASDHAMPHGNRYLYVGSDLQAFRVIVVSRAVLWACIGSLVLITGFLFTHLPHVRHPLTAVVIAVLFAGLLAVAPDAAVLAGQLGVLALVLMIVAIAIRSLTVPVRRDRVFSTSASRSSGPSTRRTVAPVDADHAALPTTQTVPAATTEAPS